MTRLDALTKQVQILVTQKSLDSVPIEHYIPFPDNDTIEKFLENDDEIGERKFELDQVLLTVVPTKSNLKTFADALTKALFTRNYVATHKWPIAK